MIRPVRDSDAPRIAGIYNHYIAHSIATFEEQSLSDEDMLARIHGTAEAALPYLVAEENGEILGYAYASKWNGRCAYKYSVEVTVYLAQAATGKGLGSALYDVLFEELRERGYHVAIAGISLPNPASIALHERFGMEKVAHFPEVGFKDERWIDVGYWQVTFRDG